MTAANKNFGFLKRRTLWGATIGGALAFFFAGIIFWGGFNTAMEASNELEFCISCHEMEENVYKEYTPTIHYSNRTGVRATCSDCHVPKDWVHKTVRKIKASRELISKALGTVSTPEKFDAHRLTMAKRVWESMKETDSRECRNCHNLESMNPKFQRPRARKQHLNAFETGQTCIDCHKGIAHKDIRELLSEEELEALETPNPVFARDVPKIFTEGLVVVEAEEQAAAEAEKAEKARQEEIRRAAEEAVQTRIQQAVEQALAAQAASANEAAGATAVAADSVQGFGLDWGDVPSREITVFYPGQTSMEWMLNGRDHGGARAFIKAGDSCASCHDQETAAMGEKMVTGEKAEPTPIKGKRGSIPVTVQAAHDGENLYLRFEWEDTSHVPVAFVEGGKMDPENAMKLAVMLATDEVQFADKAGCWGTCHHDVRSMPDTPETEALQSHELAAVLNLTEGVTKYLEETRTEIDTKGRRGAKRGGWDKLKLAEDIQASFEAGQYMDLLRYQSGDGSVEDGYVHAERVMSGGQGFVAVGRNEGGRWAVEMKRALASEQPGDVSMSVDGEYNFGFAIHDDYSNTRFHHVSLGYRLGFDNPEADINVVKREVTSITTAAPAKTTTATPAAQEAFNIDWDQADAREITVFYPGQTSMEWMLNGRDHGGARAFIKAGDSCASCHDQETAAMGEKMVTGEKAEPTPIKGKRGSIPVTVQAAHDGENLYLRFEWEDTSHVPVAFVEGGKMDPENAMKLAVMLATDEVQFADKAGCWGTCHHDVRSMPDTPETEALQSHELAAVLNLTEGVTKYLEETRTEIDTKGRRGAKRGGWDKLKLAEDIQASFEAGQYMDLLRYQSGDGSVEDGYVHAERVMSGGQGFVAVGRNEGGRWVVEMKRALASEQPGDVSMSVDGEYNFGFAIHDDYSNTRFHHVSLGYRLGFDNPEADLNARKQ